MWVFLNDAFLSIVEHRDDPATMLVRARRREDLVRALSRNPEAEGRLIDSTPEADYPFRALVPRSEVADLLVGAVNGIDYPNFKDSIPAGEKDRKRAYTRVWNEVRFGLDARVEWSEREASWARP